MKSKSIIILLLMIQIAAGCTSKPVDTPTRTSVKLLFSSEREYRYQYKNIIDFKLPHLDIEIVSYSHLQQPSNPLTAEKFAQFMIESGADLVAVPQTPPLFEELVQMGMLQELDLLIERDRFDLEGIYPGLVELIRSSGQGRLYGLATGFRSQALYFNKSLFDRYGVGYPHDGMSYLEVMELTMRFPAEEGEDRIHGFYKSESLGSFIQSIGQLENLQWLDEANRKITMRTPAWSRIMEGVQQAYRSGTIRLEASDQPTPGSSSGMQSHPFFAGKAAMMVDSSTFSLELERSDVRFDWAVVTVPTDPADPGVTTALQLGPVIGVEPFYRLGIDSRSTYPEYLPGDFYKKLEQIVQAELGPITYQNRPISEALQNIEEAAQAGWNELDSGDGS